jgi:hypothetical protein
MVVCSLPLLREPLVMDFGPLHQLLGFPETVGCQAMAPGIADAIGAISFVGDGEPRRSGDGVVHGKVEQRPTGLLPRRPPLGEEIKTVKRLVAGKSIACDRRLR